MSKQLRYLSFLLRLWQVKQNGRETWRASLEDPRTGEKRGFASLEALMDFLYAQVREGNRDENNNRIYDIADRA
jgi:hypothetical protein